MRKNIIIGNWKMNKNVNDVIDFMSELNSKKFQIRDNTIYGLAVPFVNIPFVNNLKQGDMSISSQDISEHDKGAFTGEISGEMLKALNVKYAIIGHSERRTYHFETNEIINRKAKAALKHGITPIICVGETINEYNNNDSKEVVKKQVIESTVGLDLSKIVIAYEPVWAIGTGKTATVDYAQDMCKFIRDLTSNDTLIQYGGSVTPNDIESLLRQQDIDGALVGGASLDAKSFIKLIERKK